jgi:hypothetical protein
MMTTRGVILVTYQQALGLREAMRPLSAPSDGPIEAVALLLFHEKVMLLLVQFETTPGMAQGSLPLSREECLLISQFLSIHDGDWAADILKQSRRALYEVKTGVLPAYTEEMNKVWEKVAERVSNEDSSPNDSGAK